MLSEQEIEQYCIRHALSNGSIEYIHTTRTSEPSRLVGERAAKNRITHHVSRKMGRTIAAESATVESLFVLECEYSDDVLEFWDQPDPISVFRTDKHGKPRKGAYTPDFLVLHVDGPYVAELKHADKLSELVVNRPQDWLNDGSQYVYKPAQFAFQEVGLPHQVVAISSGCAIREANLSLLLQAANWESSEHLELLPKIRELFKRQSWVSLTEVAEHLGIQDLSPILKLVAEKSLFVELDYELLSEPESTYISTTQEMASLGRATREAWNERAATGFHNSIDIMKVPTEQAAQVALKRLERVNNGERGPSVYRYKKLIKQGKEKGLTTFESLLPKTHLKGNRTPRKPRKVTETFVKFICDEWPTSKRNSFAKAHAKYVEFAGLAHPELEPVCRKTFRRWLDSQDRVRMARGRGGRRAANAAESPSSVETRQIRHTVPFDMATMDHYLTDIYCVFFEQYGIKYDARLWLSVLVDITTGEPLGRYLSLKHPSCVACGILLRDCVRRHKKLPKRIVVDRGTDFQSHYFHAVLAHTGIDKISRPPEDPKYGSEAERIFGEFKQQALIDKQGNIAAYIEARSVSSGYKAVNNVTVTPQELMLELDRFLQWRSESIRAHKAKAQGSVFKAQANRYACIGISQELTDEYILATAVDSRQYTVDPRTGIHTFTGLHYWHPKLRQLQSKAGLEVRREPENPYIVYARLNNCWLTCAATGNTTFCAKNNLMQRVEALEIMDAAEMRRKAKEDAQVELVARQKAAAQDVEPAATPGSEVSSPKANQNTANSVFDVARKSKSAKLNVDKWDG